MSIEVTITRDTHVLQHEQDQDNPSTFQVKEGTQYDCDAIWDHDDHHVRLVLDRESYLVVPKDSYERTEIVRRGS